MARYIDAAWSIRSFLRTDRCQHTGLIVKAERAGQPKTRGDDHHAGFGNNAAQGVRLIAIVPGSHRFGAGATDAAVRLARSVGRPVTARLRLNTDNAAYFSCAVARVPRRVALRVAPLGSDEVEPAFRLGRGVLIGAVSAAPGRAQRLLVP